MNGKPIKLIDGKDTQVIVTNMRIPISRHMTDSPLRVLQSDDEGNNLKTILPRKFDVSIVGEDKIYTAEKSAVDTSTHFILIKQETCFEIIPIQSWYAIQHQARKDITLDMNADQLEKKKRHALLLDERKNAFVKQKFTGEDTDFDDHSKRHILQETNQLLDKVYAEDGGLSIQHQARLKQAFKARKKMYLRDNEATENSALNMLEVKRAEVDWDWDDDGKASDDEEDAQLENEAIDYQDPDFMDLNDDDDSKIYTKFGQKVNSALELQKEQDDYDELPQFSDNEGDSDTDQSQVQSAISAEQEKPKEGVKKPKLQTSTAGGELKPNSSEAIKQKVIRILLQQGGRMSTREFIEQFNITDKVSEEFQIFKTVLNEICEVHTETKNGTNIRIIELQSQYRG